MLDINKLNVSIEDSKILNDLNLSVKTGEVHAIMGPNGSGKSTIAHTLAGNPNYQVESGSIKFNEKNLLDMEPTERSLDGLFLAFQYPVEIPGVTNSSYLRQILNSHLKHQGKDPIDAAAFLKLLKEKSELLKIPMEMHSRFVNTGFSGGEKKKNEVLQMDLLDPKLIIMDEPTAALSVKAVQPLLEQIRRLPETGCSVMIVSHRLSDLLDTCDRIYVLRRGNITHEFISGNVSETELLHAIASVSPKSQ